MELGNSICYSGNPKLLRASFFLTLPQEPLPLQGAPAAAPPRLLPIVSGHGELAGDVTQDRPPERQAACEGVVTDKPWRIDRRIGLDEEVLDFYPRLHGGRATGLIRHAGSVVTLIVHDIKLAGDPLGDGHADIQIVFIDGVSDDGAEHCSPLLPTIVHDPNRAA